MPVGLLKKWTVVAIIAASLGVIACKDDDADDPQDSGGGTPGGNQDGGGMPGGGMDAGADGGGGMGGTDAGRDGGGSMTYEAGLPCPGWDGGPVPCGSNMCFWTRTTLTCANPTCLTLDSGASVCGIDTNTLGGPEAGLPPYIQQNAPGVDSPTCAAVVDSFEPTPDGGLVDGGPKGNGLIDTTRTVSSMGMNLTVLLRYPGCCTPEGYCSGDTGRGQGALAVGGAPMYNPSDPGFGCLNNRIFFAANPAGATLRCDPQTGVFIPPTDGGTSDGGGSDAGADAGADGG